MTGFSSVGRAFDCSSFALCCYQKVAGSNPANRKLKYILFYNIYFLEYLYNEF